MKPKFISLIALAAIVALLLGFTACEKENRPRVTSIDDMMYFTLWPTEYGVIEPYTNLEAEVNSSLKLDIVRNAFIAVDYPRQIAKLEVDAENSTATLGEDFDLSATTFDFNGKDDFHKPCMVDIHDNAAGKTIVLRLVYDEYPSCPVSGRKCDRIEITVK